MCIRDRYCYWGSLLFMLAIQKGSLCQLRGVEFDFGTLSFRWYTCTLGTRMDSIFSCVVGWKADGWMPFFGMMCPEMHIMLVYRLILELLGGFGWSEHVQFTRMYILCFVIFIFRFLFLFSLFFLFEILWVYLLQTLTRPYSSTWGNQGV